MIRIRLSDQDARRLEHEYRQTGDTVHRDRPQIVRLARRDRPHQEIAADLGITPRTIPRWLNRFTEPGPIGMMAAFIGYRVAGMPGALAAMAGTFTLPWLIAAGAARMVQPFLESRWLRGFGLGAGAAVVGLQGVIAFDLARQAFTGRGYVIVALVALALSLLTKVHPILILIGGAAAGAAIG